MALSAEQWTLVLATIGIPDGDKKTEYAQILIDNDMTEDLLLAMDIRALQEIGIKSYGHCILFETYIRNKKNDAAPQVQATISLTNEVNSSTRRAPKVEIMTVLKRNISLHDFESWKGDWLMHKTLNNIPEGHLTSHLYSFCDKKVREDLEPRHTKAEIMEMSEDNFLKSLQDVVITKTNAGIKRAQFYKLCRDEGERLQDWMTRLQIHQKDCKFHCCKCNQSNGDSYIHDQFVIGINDARMQIELFAKLEADELKTPEALLKHAEVLETAIASHNELTNDDSIKSTVAKIGVERGNTHKRNYSNQQSWARDPGEYCTNCGNKRHESMSRCPARGKACFKCGVDGHFGRLCRSNDTTKRPANYRAKPWSHNKGSGVQGSRRQSQRVQQIEDCNADVEKYSDDETNFVEVFSIGQSHKATQQIKSLITPLPAKQCDHKGLGPFETLIFPDSGASLCIAGPQHQKLLGIKQSHLNPSNKQVRGVGGAIMRCYGSCKVRFVIGKLASEQELYFCEGVTRIYFGKAGCIDVNILHPSFPQPMDDIVHHVQEPDVKVDMCEAPPASVTKQPSNGPGDTKNEIRVLPRRRSKIPFHPCADNIGKLKQSLWDDFGNTAFNRNGAFPTMPVTPMSIKLQSNAKPKARNIPNTVPLPLKAPTKEKLDFYVGAGILRKLHVDEVTEWRTAMVPQTKKDGSVRITCDYQHLNSQCVWTPYLFSSPFHLASQVPCGTFKSVLDAVDGYFSVPLDEYSSKLTAFLTEWGTYVWSRAPQGFFGSGDKYNGSYDEIIANVPRLLKIIDDVLLYDYTIEEHYWHVWNFFVFMCIKWNCSKLEKISVLWERSCVCRSKGQA